jgi:beta-1,4-N-acetylglucosaminyltransferase
VALTQGRILQGDLQWEAALIFVTVSSTAPFYGLVSKVDSLTGKAFVCSFITQIVNGTYIPKNAEWFRFKDKLTEDYRSADLVITHTVAGTLFEMGKKAIAVPNPDVVQNHDIANRLSTDGYILFCPGLGELEEMMSQTKIWEPKRYVEERCMIDNDIVSYLLGRAK